MNSPVYVAGLERGVRPIGLWSMSMTLSMCSRPVMRSCSAGNDARAIEVPRERTVQDVLDERRLARARHAGDGDEEPERDLDVDVAQVVLARALTMRIARFGIGAPALGGDRDLQLAAAGTCR